MEFGVHSPYQFPFSEPHLLIAPDRVGVALMRFDIAAVNHQPLQVGVIGHGVQQFGPGFVPAPAAEPAMNSVAVFIVRGQGGQDAPARSAQDITLLKRRLFRAGRLNFAGAAGMATPFYLPEESLSGHTP